MQKTVIILISICLLLCSCSSSENIDAQTNEISDQEANKISERETTDFVEEKYDCFSFELNAEAKNTLAQYFATLSGRTKLKLKVHDMHLINYYNFEKEIIEGNGFYEFLLNDNKLCYVVENSNDGLLNLNFGDTGVYDKVDYSTIESEKNAQPDWTVVHEYVQDPSKVFGDQVNVQDVFCISASGRSTYKSTYKCLRDLFIYYVTDKGEYMLYKPYIYEYPENWGQYNDDIGSPIPVGYSEDIYLLPMSVMKEMAKYIDQYLEDNNIHSPSIFNYYGESQIYRVTDIEPYKLVPGQLPE